MSRNDALAAYEALPLPDTTEEHWRFTNLRGFDPESFAGAASAEIETLLDLDVAGYATVTADGIEIEKAPEGVTFEPLPEEHRMWDVPGLIVSPHMSADTIGWRDDLAEQFLDNYARWVDGRPLFNVVDKRLGYVPVP